MLLVALLFVLKLRIGWSAMWFTSWLHVLILPGLTIAGLITEHPLVAGNVIYVILNVVALPIMVVMLVAASIALSKPALRAVFQPASGPS